MLVNFIIFVCQKNVPGQQGTIPTCPLCRGALQINRRRMQQFMTSAEAEDWDEEEINFVQTMIKMAG